MPDPASFLTFNWNLPFSGNVTEDIHPVFHGSYQGSLAIEAAIAHTVAGPGEQLKRIERALVEVIRGERGQATTDFLGMVEAIEDLKRTLRTKAGAEAVGALDRLAAVDPDAFRSLVEQTGKRLAASPAPSAAAAAPSP